MTTTADLIEQTRRHLGLADTLNEAQAIGLADATVTLSRTIHGTSTGGLLSVGLESMYVWSANVSSRTVDVRRGHEGSTATSHAAGSLVRVNPVHSDFAILQALNAELRALSGNGLFHMKTLELTTSSSARTYNLADDVLDVYRVFVDYSGDTNTWPEVRSWVARGDMSPGEFASGWMLRLDEAAPADRPMRVLYRARFGELATLSDDVLTETGLRESAHDILPLGAAWRLTAPTEVARNQTRSQGDSRRAEEVPPGAKMRSALGIQQIRQERIREELANQERMYPRLRR